MQNLSKNKAHLRIGNQAFCGERRARIYAGVGEFTNFCKRCLRTVAAEKLEEEAKLRNGVISFYGYEPDEFWYKSGIMEV